MIGNLLGEYKNGNYNVQIYNDGTKIRETEEDEFISEFPECIDVKITDYCDLNCPYCHEASTVKGSHGNILQASFIDTLQPYTELAIGGGNPLSHPDLIKFLENLKSKNIIANITVNQLHFLQRISMIWNLVDKDLVKGIGISITDSGNEAFYSAVRTIPNAVIHTINGITSITDYRNMAGKNLKILILGYKKIRRGRDYLLNDFPDNIGINKRTLYKYLPYMINLGWFNTVSFDNLAIEQLRVKRLMSEEKWNEFYMGDDGQFTMYIDLVKREFASSSVSPIKCRLLHYIKEMFDVVKHTKELEHKYS